MKTGTCKHFTGIQHDCCAAGINYDEITKTKTSSLPCIKGFLPKRPQAPCTKFEEPSPEELAAEEAAHKSHMELLEKSFPIVSRIKKQHRGKSWSGTVECPGCSAKLHISHSGYNGHVGVHCETENCISFQE